jgi:hypothetical protein
MLPPEALDARTPPLEGTPAVDAPPFEFALALPP